LPALALCSFGIALGRFERLNSWDALVDPSRVLDTLTAHAAQPPLRGLAMLVVATLALGVAYLVLVSFAGLVSDEARRSAP
jgi:uncharacterized membrane protein